MKPSSIDSWLSSLRRALSNTKPDWEWQNPISEDSTNIENYHRSSFLNFMNYPMSSLGIDLILEGKILQKDEKFREKAIHLLDNVHDLSFERPEEFIILSMEISKDPRLLLSIPKDPPIVIYVWCLLQAINININLVLSLWHDNLFHPPPLFDRVDLHAVLLFIDLADSKWDNDDIPPLTSDEYETIFALAYCTDRGNVKMLARFVLLQLQPKIVSSRAAHLLFQRFLPYCAMQNPEGREFALGTLEQIFCNHSRYPSCVSTWITLHPYCVAASNNLLVDLRKRGLITTQMKSLVRHLQKTNKLLLSNQICLTEEGRLDLPRSLWRVPFPPPVEEIKLCDQACRKVLSSIESKRYVLLPIIVLLVSVYLAYAFLL